MSDDPYERYGGRRVPEKGEVTQVSIGGKIKEIDPPVKLEAGQDVSVNLETGEVKVAELIDHPAHYGGDTPYEVIKVLRAWLTPEEFRGFLKGNVIKYLARAGKKGSPVDDQKKGAWYARELAEEKR